MISPGDKPGIGWGWFFMAPGDLYVELLVYLVVTGTVSKHTFIEHQRFAEIQNSKVMIQHSKIPLGVDCQVTNFVFCFSITFLLIVLPSYDN